jgi:enoyl-CoA hydratase
MGSPVTYTQDGPIIRIAMDDGKLNVLSSEMLDALHAAFERALDQGMPVILSGRQGAMSAGFDLKVMTSAGSARADLVHSGFRLAERMLSFPAPLVVACTGHAIAMGLFMVISGDYRIGAAGPFRLTANEVATGMMLPRTPIEICRYKLVPGYFDRTVTLAEVFSPSTAVSAGILDRVVDPADIDAAATELAIQLASLDIPAHRVAKQRARESLLRTLHTTIADDYAESQATTADPA